MVHKFIISKKSVNLELHVDGKVEVKPLPENEFSKETMEVLARAHQVFFQGYFIRNKEQDLLPAAIRYFRDNGFEIKDNTDDTDP